MQVGGSGTTNKGAVRRASFRSPLRSLIATAGAALVLAFGLASSAGPATAAAGLEGIPAYSHVVTIVLENESFDSTYGPGWKREGAKVTHRPNGAFCYTFAPLVVAPTGYPSVPKFSGVISSSPMAI